MPKVNAYSALMLPGSFARSTLVRVDTYEAGQSTFAPAPVPWSALDTVQFDLDSAWPDLRLVWAPPEVPDLPYVDRADLPMHERSISAAALAQFRVGAEDVRAGRVRLLRPEDLESSDE